MSTDSMSELGSAFGQSLDRLLSDHDAANQPSSGRGVAWSEKLWDELDALGLPLLMVEESNDGAGGSASDLFDVLSVAGRYAAAAPSTEPVIAAWLASTHGLSLPSGMPTVAVADSDLTVEINGDSATLNGTLKNVPWGRAAASIAFVVGDESPFLIITKPGEVTENQNLAEEPSDSVHFANQSAHSVCAAKLTATGLLRMAALARSAQLCGAMHAVLEMTMQYVSDREQFGRPLRKFQAIQHHLAIMYSDVVAASTATRGALELADPANAPFESAAAIVRTREAATRIAATAHQAHGAIGFTADYALGRLTKRLWAWRDEYGDEKWWRESLGELVLRDNEKSLWELLTDASG